MRHYLSPDEESHPPQIGTHSVFPLLLAKDAVRSGFVWT
jgi:hypothetical protein